MGIDLENPGSNSADLQAAFSNLAGQTILQKTVITTPVEYVDLVLPENYLDFRVVILALELNAPEFLALDFSPDGGTTWHSDSDGALGSGNGTYAAYDNEYWRNNNGPTVDSGTNNSGGIGPDSVLRVQRATMNIYPGGDDNGPSMDASVMSWHPENGKHACRGYVWLLAATGRQNLLRIAPYTFFDVPSSNTFVAGTFLLIGSGLVE
jgi:hypothetical protein